MMDNLISILSMNASADFKLTAKLESQQDFVSESIYIKANMMPAKEGDAPKLPHRQYQSLSLPSLALQNLQNTRK